MTNLADSIKMQRWISKTAERCCSKCIDTCCDGVKHAITMYENETKPFVERGIPIYSFDKFNLIDLVRWRKEDLSGCLFTKKGEEVSKPALIETRKSLGFFKNGSAFSEGEKNFTLYVDKYCPFYNEKTGCYIHEDERRPKVCKNYPVFPIYDESDCFIISPTCKLFNHKKIRENFRKNFPEPDFKLSINTKEGFTTYSSEGLNQREYGREIKK